MSVQSVYLALFGRPADPGGLAYWNEVTNGGKDLSVMLKVLPGLTEYTTRFEGMDNTQVVTTIYKNLFGREPDAGGLAYFTEALANGTQSIATIAVNILDGAQGEDLSDVAAKEEAANLFTESLDTPEEIEAYKGDVAAQGARAFLDNVDAENPATPESVQNAVEAVEAGDPNGGQEPDEDEEEEPVDQGPGPQPEPDPVDVFLTRWTVLDEQYYAFAARSESDTGQNEDVNNAFILLANDYVAYLNAGGAAITDVIQQKVKIDGVYKNDSSRIQTFHDNVLGNINDGALGGSRPKDLSLVSNDARAFGDRPFADGKPADKADENKAWAWDLANGIESDNLPADNTVIVANGENLARLGDVSTSIATSITSAVTTAISGSTIHLLPGTYNEQVILTGNKDLTFLAEDGAKIERAGSEFGLNATGAGFDGIVTIDGLTVVAGSKGGIVQSMSASAGQLIVTDNVIRVSATSYSANGNGIQISGEGSKVTGNFVDATPYLSATGSWSTSGILAVKDASHSVISNNTIQLASGRPLGPEQSAVGIGIDAHWGDALTDIVVSGNRVTSLTNGISLAERVEVDVIGNILSGNEYGISLGTTTDGWDDDFEIVISGNTFADSQKADISFFDFEAGEVVIGVNDYSDDVPAIWFDEDGTFGSGGSAELSIDITAFVDGNELADGVFVSSGSGFDALTLTRGDDADDWTLSQGSGVFDDLEIKLVGSAAFSEAEVAGMFASTTIVP